MDPVIESSPAEVDEVGGCPRHAIHEDFGLDDSHGRLEGGHRIGLAQMRIRVGVIVLQPAATTTHP